MPHMHGDERSWTAPSGWLCPPGGSTEIPLGLIRYDSYMKRGREKGRTNSYMNGVKMYLVKLGHGVNPSLQPGYLLLSMEENWVWLKNESKLTVRKGKVGPDFITQLVCGSTIRVADYSIKVLKDVSKNKYNEEKQTDSTRTVSTPADQTDAGTGSCTSITGSDSRNRPMPTSTIAFLDPVLMRSMRPYQIQAAEFLLRRLQDVDGTSTTGIPLTGAVLADDMGTGKTLVGLSVLWALCRHGRGKGLVVCPSSLVTNWRREVSKWLPGTLGRTALYAVGGKSSSSLSVSMRPTLCGVYLYLSVL